MDRLEGDEETLMKRLSDVGDVLATESDLSLRNNLVTQVQNQKPAVERVCARNKAALTVDKNQPPICLSLLRLDPILQFLTRATGKPLVPLKTIKATLPCADDKMLRHIGELALLHGVLQIVHLEGLQSDVHACLSWDSEHVCVAFPSPHSSDNSQNKLVNISGTLHGSTKAAAKRRMATLKRSLKKDHKQEQVGTADSFDESTAVTSIQQSAKDWNGFRVDGDVNQQAEVVLEEEIEARDALLKTFSFVPANGKPIHQDRLSITCMLPRQASYAGSSPARESTFGDFGVNTRIPVPIMDAFDINSPCNSPLAPIGRKLYSHQTAAIESAINGVHTLVCTGTGSGKSLCFLIPVLAAALTSNDTSLLLFPTKALAQDQMMKLWTLIRKNSELQEKVRPGIIDGDTSHADRDVVARNCNVIMTNPDTLHAAILPGWKANYKNLLGRIKFVVIDEAHMYEGVFGAHVAMVLSRFVRIAAVCSYEASGIVRTPTFLACSATMFHPEHHFRLLCPIPTDAKVEILSPDDDGSPRAAKHFFVWNPPIMDLNGFSAGRVTPPRKKTRKDILPKNINQRFQDNDGVNMAGSSSLADEHLEKGVGFFRRHPADETALLLARAVSLGVRCIAFCTTRCLVEWVYERAVLALKANSNTEHLANKIESYRGGYTMEVRRSIESRLFSNDLLGVIGTNALELGVDVGGIDLTLHCGYPRSYASLLQQAGRAGRGSARLDVPSIAVMVCFNSPAEQQIWKRPQTFLGRGKSALVSMPINVGLVQGHLLCAGEEYPLMASNSITSLFSREHTNTSEGQVLADSDLFGSNEIYQASIEGLLGTGMLKEESIPVADSNVGIVVFKTHPFVGKPWTSVNLRSIEPVNYAIVDLSHPMQGRKIDGVSDQRAVLDTIPYSRVFYHAFPGAIITHRGQRYKVMSMTRPPAFGDSCAYKGGTFAAYAQPTRARYTTRPLSSMKITIVKQIDRIDVVGHLDSYEKDGVGVEKLYGEDDEWTQGSLAGNGVLTVCRTVHGYKKLSPITRVEMSRSEFSLPSMQFDTFGFWLDTEASLLRDVIKDYDEGVHALSHAILAVAPLFVPCAGSDLNCDHRYRDCTRIVIFDMRAGGSGVCAQLFKCIFVPDGLLETAIDLIETCDHCCEVNIYEGGCPACLHFGHCIMFNQNLNRRAAIQIGRILLQRVQKTTLYTQNAEMNPVDKGAAPMHDCNTSRKRSHTSNQTVLSPRRKARDKALRRAKEEAPTKERNVVMGRTSWPTDQESSCHVEAD